MITKLISIQKELKSTESHKETLLVITITIIARTYWKQLKPLLAKQECVLTISDSIENIGSRYYVKATAKDNRR